MMDTITELDNAVSGTAQQGELSLAVCEAVKAMPSIPKRGEMNMHGRKYKYATVEDMLSVVVPALAEHGVRLQQMPIMHGDASWLLTRLDHGESGQWSRYLTPLPYNPDPQRYGSNITYMRRYTLMCVLGIAPCEDDDGATGGGSPRQPAKPRQTRRKPQPKQQQKTAEPASDDLNDGIDYLRSAMGKQPLSELTAPHRKRAIEKVKKSYALGYFARNAKQQLDGVDNPLEALIGESSRRANNLLHDVTSGGGVITNELQDLQVIISDGGADAFYAACEVIDRLADI